MAKTTDVDRFWSKVRKTETCWLWTGGQSSGGYGSFSINRVTIKPHRYAYELLVGPIPDGMQIDHLCKVRHCVNPAHLEPVTQQVNLERRWPADVCRNGHERPPATDGKQARCEECHQAWWAANRDRVNARKAAQRAEQRVAP